MSGPRIGELFAGYGGLGLGVKATLGGEVVWVSDIDKGACKILAHRFPGVPNLGDITTVDWSQVEPVDVLTGGSPCQDLSHAGRRAGMNEGTRSNLWVASSKGNPQLSARFVEWMQGLPAGWVTDVPAITRNEALKALGNGVVPLQVEAAVRWLWQYVPASVRAALLEAAA